MGVYLTLGTYDGVHLGHQKIIKTLKDLSRGKGVPSKLLFFPVPPRFFLSGDSSDNILTTEKERLSLLEKTGIDIIEKIEFDSRLAATKAETFLKEILIKKHGAAGLVVGRDFALGRDRECGIQALKDFCLKHGLVFEAVDFVRSGEHKVSSSLIRSLLHKGEIEEANRCLSRDYFVTAKVVRGAGLGRKIGFPTANLASAPEKLLPKGVYAVRVLCEGSLFRGVASIGHRPTLKTLDSGLIMETHILDFDLDIYEKEITVYFVKKIRNETRFSGISELISGIKSDIEKSRRILND